MKAEFFRQLLEVFASWIANVGPDNVAVNYAKVAYVSREAVICELLRVSIEADCGDHYLTPQLMMDG